MKNKPGFRDLFAGEVTTPASHKEQATEYLQVAEDWDQHHSADAYRQLAIFYAIMHLVELVEERRNDAGN